MASAEAEMRQGDLSAMTDTLNRIIHDYSQSHEAQTVFSLVRMVRQQGSTPYVDSISSCTLSDAQSIKKTYDSMESIVEQYPSVSSDKRAALDAIFGPATFSSPDLTLDGLLSAERQLEAARQKALEGQ